MLFLWNYVLGPVLAFLPLRWRRLLPYGSEVDWTRAGTASGIYEMAAALVALGYWYVFEMTRRINQILDSGVNEKIPGGMTDMQVRGAALTLFVSSILTWVLAYFLFEGAVRLCGAAFTEHVMGTLPLYLVERLLFALAKPEEARVGATVKEHAHLFAEAIREKAMVARLKEVPDEVHFSKSAEEEFLEIHASRKKEEWIPPKVVRVNNETYYRLEESWTAGGSRPFRYKLRRLAAGVPGRKVLLYQIAEEEK